MATKKDAPVFFYEREYYMLSNFAAFAVEYDGELWPTAEHAYQAMKFFYHQGEIRDLIRNARSPYDAKKIAHAYDDEKRDDWHEVRLEVMEDVVYEKIFQHPYIQDALLKTEEREIIEDSHKDAFWGWGPRKDGENHLGKILMGIRSKIQKNIKGGRT